MKKAYSMYVMVMLAATLALGLVVAGCAPASSSGGGGGDEVNKTALNTAIADANTAKSGVVVSTAAANVSVGKQWVTQAEMTALTDLIAGAATVRDSSDATQALVDTAKNALTIGIDTFNTAKKDGTGAALNTSALVAKIAEANAAKLGVEVSTDGADVPSATKWVTQGALDTFNTAISTAEVVRDTETVQATVDTAVSTLGTAITTFTSAQAAGTKTSGYSTAQLANLIVTATTLQSSVTVAANGDNIAPSAWWVAETHKTALGTAISDAQAITAAGTPLDNAYTTLAGAINNVNTNKAQGTPTATMKGTLTTKITDADEAKKDVQTAATAANAPLGSKWATTAQWAPLNKAYDDALVVLNDANATKTAVETATTALTNATTTFSGLVSSNGLGTYAPAVSAALVGSPVTINAVVGTALATNNTLTATLTNAVVKETLTNTDISGSFSATIPGLTYKATATAGASSITVTISGAATAAQSTTPTVSIPASVLKYAGGQDYTGAAVVVTGSLTIRAAFPTVSAALAGSPRTISAVVGTALATNNTLTATLTNAVVKTALNNTDISTSFSETISGLTYKATAAANATSITVTISGTATAAKNTTPTVSIPASVLKYTSGGDYTGAAVVVTGTLAINATGGGAPGVSRSIKVTGIEMPSGAPAGDYYLAMFVSTEASTAGIVAGGSSGKLTASEATIDLYQTTGMQPTSTRWQGAAGAYFLMIGVYFNKDPATITNFETEEPFASGYASVTFGSSAVAELAFSELGLGGGGGGGEQIGSIAGTVTLTNVPTSGVRGIYISANGKGVSWYSSYTGQVNTSTGAFSIPLYEEDSFDGSMTIGFSLYVDYTDGSYFNVGLSGDGSTINSSGLSTSSPINVGNVGNASLANIKLSGTVTATIDNQPATTLSIIILVNGEGYEYLGSAWVSPVAAGQNNWAARIAPLSTSTTVKFAVDAENAVGGFAYQELEVTKAVYNTDVSGIALGTVALTSEPVGPGIGLGSRR